MPPNARTVPPRNFFLNEQHELAPGEKRGGGPAPEYLGINWATKGTRINQSLLRVRDFVSRSRDPLRQARYFVLARPTRGLEKKSRDKRKAQGGKLAVEIDYAEDESRVFGRLGLDLIQVNPDGSATVHARPERFEQLVHSSQILQEFGAREKARWATLDSFEAIPQEYVVDGEWVNELSPKTLIDAVIELQPLLTIVEADQVTRAVADMLGQSQGGELRGIGTDFSGRRWLTAKLIRDSLQKLAQTFFSIQTIHPPLFAAFLASPRGAPVPAGASKPTAAPVPADLPCVAVVDTGVPADHVFLGNYQRGRYIAPNSPTGANSGSHGSLVASRVVFGDLDCSAGVPSRPSGQCSFYDVNIALDDRRTDEKGVLTALEAIVGVAPDVRVFNLSFDNVRPLDLELPTVRREKLILVQDLDNFIFARDVLVVVAAGNSEQGILPATPYPRHLDDPQWALGTWPRSFNALTCGSFIEQLHAEGVANQPGAPSPFTKIGPGLCESPKPDLSEHGGNGNAAYRFQPGLGVWGCTATGQWEDRSGTSFAAPVLARHAAIVLRHLQQFCEPGTRPFAAAAKAYLILSASRRPLSPALQPLAALTLGTGKADPSWLQAARADRAMFMWQGLLGGPGELARVQLPVPRQWLTDFTFSQSAITIESPGPVHGLSPHGLISQCAVRYQTQACPNTCEIKLRLS